MKFYRQPIEILIHQLITGHRLMGCLNKNYNFSFRYKLFNCRVIMVRPQSKAILEYFAVLICSVGIDSVRFRTVRSDPPVA
jgi:hypothetical protein